MLDETVDEPLIHPNTVKKQGLCSKYDISIDKLEFDYINDCKNVKELERIVKILRSGEEGYYPDLQKHAENQLQMLAPNSRLLRVEEPIVRRETMMPEERDEVDNEIKQWAHDMSSKDEELMDWNKNYPAEAESGDFIPPVRRAPKPKSGSIKEQNQEKKIKKPVVSDYTTWDKYDPDAEILKMEAEEERKKMDAEIELKKQKAAAAASHKKAENSRLNYLINAAETLPDAEKSFQALREKDRGNEYYKTCNYDDAIDYYTASITICPNAIAYNNRAACYLKQGKYDLALSDVNNCLELDPENTKGLYRRGLCLQHKNSFEEALQDMQAVLRKEPHNLLVQHVAKELRQQCRSVPRSVRMLVEEETDDKVVVISECEAQKMKAGFEVNDWGLAKNMCSCYGRPQFLRTLNRSGIADHLIYKPEEKNINDVEIEEKESSSFQNQTKTDNSIHKSITEIVCNGNESDDPMETNRIVYGCNNMENESDDLIPKKIKIIETVKVNNDSSGSIKERDKPKKCIVKDMRGQKHVQGQSECEMTEQFSNITIGEPSNDASVTESLNENKNRRSNTKQKHNNNQTNNERNNRTQQNRNYEHPTPVRNYEFNVPSEKQPITVANKYTQKVASSKNVNAQNDSMNDEYRNINNINNISNINSSENLSNDSSMTSFQFYQSWRSVKDTSSFKEYADLLRRVRPSKLHSVLGNNWDDSMLLAMLKAFSSEFDNTNHVEADLVKQYLVELSKVERFIINVQFLSSDVKQLTSCLIDKVGGDDASELKKVYMV